ncbi:MAG: secretin and TonB N-terminal domain-containing protein [Planctomycetaceae bacterium]|nr:secretin and TonB N-terminal domain-containing protein [Planctomycetaceae bacterium]
MQQALPTQDEERQSVPPVPDADAQSSLDEPPQRLIQGSPFQRRQSLPPDGAASAQPVDDRSSDEAGLAGNQADPDGEPTTPEAEFDAKTLDPMTEEGLPVPHGRLTVDEDGVVNIPFNNSDTVVTRKDLELRMNDGLITLIAREASLSDILAILAQDHGLNIVSSESITEKVTVTLRDVPLADALNAILSIQGLSWSRRNNIISISKLSTTGGGSAIVQGRVIRVYPLSYVSSTEVEAVVKDLISPVGRVKSMVSEKVDTRKSADRLIVEDLPEYLDRIDLCIRELDRPPKQVQIEAHILEVDLSAENRHGVNLEVLSDVSGSRIFLKTPGFGKSTSSPAMLFGIDGNNVDGLLDALKATVDARTLASPHVLVTHGQEAKIQIGGKIGYRQSTTTETSTVQGVEFLDIGVVLTVTPYIGADGQILLKVNPEVSDGQIDQRTELPDEQITTVNSTVLLNDGQGMVIGGLIREVDDDQRAKAPFLGEFWMVGKLFQSVRQIRSRKEVIVVLVPRIVECPCPTSDREKVQLDRTQTPIFHGALQREYRPWEPELPEVHFRPREWRKAFGELRSSEGMRLTSEPPRTMDPYLDGTEIYSDDAGTGVTVTVEPDGAGAASGPAMVPPEVPPVPAGFDRGMTPEDAPKVMQIPNEVSEGAGVRQTSGTPGSGGANRQKSPDRKNQAFHGTQQKSELPASSNSTATHRRAAAVGSSSKGQRLR